MKPSVEVNRAALFPGDSEMARRMRALDWSKTALGSIERWPQSLRTSVSICLDCAFPILVWWGPEFVMLYNDEYRPILGSAKHPAALGERGAKVWPEIWDVIGPMLTQVMQRGEATRSRDLLLLIERHEYLEETYFSFSYSPIRDESGGVGGVFCPVIETTEKVIGERRLRTLRDLAAQSTETAQSACQSAAKVLAANRHDLPFTLIYLLDADARSARLAGSAGLPEGSPAAPRRLDLSAPDGNGAGGWPLRAVLEAGRAEVVTELARRFGALPEGVWPESPHTAVVLPVMKSGQDLLAGLLVAGVSPRRPLDDRYRGFFELVANQIATAVANARAHEEERKRTEALAELDRAKTAFFTNVSHEFRTPLTLLLGPSEDALADVADSEQRERLEVIHRNALRLQKLVNTLLDFSRIEAGRIQASYQPTDLATLTGELASVFRSAVEKAGMRLLHDCPRLPEPVYVDRDMYEKVVLNLLSNAFKFTLEGDIEVSLRDAGEAVELSVRDTGTGIPAEQLPHIFERFHRVECVRGRTGEGTGIGLALVRELVKLHGGTVSVQSVWSQGSTFTVTLPKGNAHLPAGQIEAARRLASTALTGSHYLEEALRWLPGEPSPLPATALMADRAGPDSPRPRVVWADDNADMREYVRRLLGSAFEVEVVADGEAALAAARRGLPDLVLTDVMMPRLDGFGLLRALRADDRTRTMPVILLSARAGEEARVEGMQAGADDYLTKPFSARELLARVEAAIRLGGVRREAEAAIREQAERLRIVQDQAPVGICENDLEGRFLRVNDQLCEITGYSREELLARRFQDITHSEDIQADIENYRRLQAEGFPSYRMEKRYIHKDGHAIWIELYGFLARDSEGKPRFGVSIVQDITERRRAEEEIHRLNEQLEERVRQRTARLEEIIEELESFSYSVSHDLRAPIRHIEGFARLLNRKAAPALDEAALHYLDVILESAEHAGDLVDDLLSFSRMGRSEVRPSTVDTNRLVREALNELKFETEGRDITWKIGELPEVGGDLSMLRIVWWNLLSNAVKFTRTRHKAVIEVGSEKDGEETMFFVRDNGVGFDMKYLDKLFGVFQRLHRAEEFEGTGIGLANVQRIVQKHGGRVWAEGAVDVGATFYFSLPSTLRKSNGDFG